MFVQTAILSCTIHIIYRVLLYSVIEGERTHCSPLCMYCDSYQAFFMFLTLEWKFKVYDEIQEMMTMFKLDIA